MIHQPVIKKVGSSSVNTYPSARLMKTGQTTSYRTGDDGDIEAGREDSFFVLKENNPFGNTNRFTDEFGGQTYTNNIVIDWSTFDGVSVLGYYRVYLASGYWDNVVDLASSLSIWPFSSGWHLTNRNELQNIISASTYSIDYSPFNLATSINIWTSTTLFIDNTSAYICNTAFGNISYLGKNSLNTPKGIAVRTFTVTGTTLT